MAVQMASQSHQDWSLAVQGRICEILWGLEKMCFFISLCWRKVGQQPQRSEDLAASLIPGGIFVLYLGGVGGRASVPGRKNRRGYWELLIKFARMLTEFSVKGSCTPLRRGLAALYWNIIQKSILRNLHKSWKWSLEGPKLHQQIMQNETLGASGDLLEASCFQDREKGVPWSYIFRCFCATWSIWGPILAPAEF